MKNQLNLKAMKNLLLIVVLIFAFGCSGRKNAETAKDNVSDHPQAEIINGNTQIISEKAVIFLFPDSLELKNWQEEYDEETYNEIIADMTWYPGLAGESLDELNIKNFYSDKEYLLFIMSDNTELKLKRKDVDGNMIVFHPDKDLLITYSVYYDMEAVLNHLK